MRLIDVDKLLFSLEEWELNETPISTYPKPKEFTADDMQRMIWRTIRDCKSAVEEQPTVEAITVEWIEKYAKRFIELENRNYFAYRGFSDIGEAILNMLENWEKENGTEESVRNTGI